MNGKICNIVNEVVTFDFVNEGGILDAMKYRSIGLESIANDHGLQITPELLVASEKLQHVGFESSGGLTTTMIRDCLGWNKVKLITPESLCSNLKVVFVEYY